MLATTLSSHASNGVVEVTCPQHDVNVESCWRQCYRVMLAMALPMWLGRDVISMLSHASDGDAESC
jgi:hypothetical protein